MSPSLEEVRRAVRAVEHADLPVVGQRRRLRRLASAPAARRGEMRARRRPSARRWHGRRSRRARRWRASRERAARRSRRAPRDRLRWPGPSMAPMREHLARLRRRTAVSCGSGDAVERHRHPRAARARRRRRRWKRSVGPATVSSSAAVVVGIADEPVGEAERARRPSGPLGGTPTCQRPRRPGQSCRLDCAPGASTSMRRA